MFMLSKKPVTRFMKNFVMLTILQAAFLGPKLANAEANGNKKNDGKDTKAEKGWLFEFANNAKKASEEGDFFGKFKNGVKDVILSASASAPPGLDDKIKTFMESRMPGEIGYGLLMGYSSGYFLKKVSKVMAFVMGGAFVVLQCLSYSGVVRIDYDKMQKTIEECADVNDDGKFDEKDVEFGINKVQSILQHNMPAGGGFSIGFLFGLRA